MSDVAIITSIYDNYDHLKDIVPQSIDVEWICVTDTYHADKLKGWKVYYEPKRHLHPNRAAKTAKCLPWLYTHASSSIWIDASYQVVSPNFAEEALRYADPVAQFPHPWRNCAYDEADESLRLPKYEDQYGLIQEQKWALNYVYEHPRNYGLWATGVIVRQHTVKVVRSGFDWLNDIYTWSYQDQISHPNAMRNNHIDIINLPGTHLANEWLDYQGSGRHQ